MAVIQKVNCKKCMNGLHQECADPDTCLCAESHGKTQLEKEASEQLKQMLDNHFDEISIQKLGIAEYQVRLQEKFKLLKDAIEINFRGRSFVLEACLSVKAQLKIKNLTQPFALILMGNPSTKKSTILEVVNSLLGCYKSDKFTPKSFVSHSANVKKEELGKIDLLPRIRHKTLICPELAPLFSGNEENLIEIFGLLTRVLDGRGLELDSGVHGKRGYSGDYHFMMLGAVVDIPRKVWKVLGNLGPRLYFLRIPDDSLEQKNRISEIKSSFKSKPYNIRLEECQESCKEFWKYVENNPMQDEDKKIHWDSQRDDPEVHERIIEVAMLLAKLRAVIPTWHTSDSDSSGLNYNFEMPIEEDPERASNALYNLARGYALLFGRNFITKDDLNVVIPIALSSAERERVALFKLLIENKGKIDSKNFEEKSGVSKNTALKQMKQLDKLGLVDLVFDEAETKPRVNIQLKNTFDWFISDEFREYWDRFVEAFLTPKNSAQSQENAEKDRVSKNQQTLDSQIPTLKTEEVVTNVNN